MRHRIAFDIEQQIRRLDVAVHDAEFVRGVQRLGGLNAKPGHGAEVPRIVVGVLGDQRRNRFVIRRRRR